MSDHNDALFPIVQDFIEFEALLLQARQALSDYSSQSWSNTDEHDPGITLLQAMCYNTSDLAYRSSLPLRDLLTPAPQDQKEGEGIFPAIFGPQQALTCGPVSEDDYRRALLDLRCRGPQGEYFCFSNVKLVREPEEERYRYWYNIDEREYSFIPAEDDPSVEMTLLGNYYLYLQPSRETEADNHQAALTTLEAYLRDHRNIGEAVSRIIWLVPEDIMVNAVIELREDIDVFTAVAPILAAIYTAIEHYVTPPVIRCSTEQLLEQGLNNEEIYQGPYLHHGWIPVLPPALDVSQSVTINLARLVNILLAIDGVKTIRTLKASPDPDDNTWVWTASAAGVYPRLWGADPIELLAQGKVIRLMVNGIEWTASAEDIRKELTPASLIVTPPVILPYGRWRNPAQYHPLTNEIPPCYGLLQLPATPEQVQLHQFLLPFEQLLANGCQQLALLPNSLAFNRKINDVVWGEQWPFPPRCVSDVIFQGYSASLKDFLSISSQDMAKELSCIDYLLRYFNSRVAPRTFTIDAQQFMGSQQGYLSKISQLTYQRANIRTDKVSALQQRIAARLGIGGAAIFDENVPLDSLPFYIVEHRALLPVYPDPFYNSLQTPHDLYEEAGNLIVVLPLTSEAPLRVGQLVNLILTTNEVELTIRALMIARVNSQSHNFSLEIAANAQLQRHLAEILDPANTVRWQNCQVWMEDMYYPLVYAEDQSGLTMDQRRLTSSPQSPYPALVRVGDWVAFEYHITPGILADAPFQLLAEVVAADNIANTLVVKKISGSDFPQKNATQGYFVYFDSTHHEIRDRFSFVVSVVFNRDHLDLFTSDIYATNAWMKDTILDEFPSYISMMMHWMPQDQFKNFAYTYNTWQSSGATLGDASYSIMRMLTLGCLPSSLTGIGAMYIATPEQRSEVVGVDGDEWNSQVIIEEELFYVPPKTPGAPDS